jgi:hypothetical protein
MTNALAKAAVPAVVLDCRVELSAECSAIGAKSSALCVSTRVQ